MKAFSAIVHSLLFLGVAHALPNPLKEALPVPRDVTEVLKRAGAQIYSCTVPNTAALTFDDGPWYYMTDIGNILHNAGANGTFFVNGNNWGCIYDFVDHVQGVYAQGHQLGSHTWSHSNLATLSWDQIHDEMWRVELALQRIIGAQPAHMRPPYGSFNQLVIDASNIRGQDLILWDFDSGDANGEPPADSKAAYTALANSGVDTILALNHETYDTSVYDVLPHAISVLQNAGYELVTVAQCLGAAPYQWVGTPQTPTGDWHC